MDYLPELERLVADVDDHTFLLLPYLAKVVSPGSTTVLKTFEDLFIPSFNLARLDPDGQYFTPEAMSMVGYYLVKVLKVLPYDREGGAVTVNFTVRIMSILDADNRDATKYFEPCLDMAVNQVVVVFDYPIDSFLFIPGPLLGDTIDQLRADLRLKGGGPSTSASSLAPVLTGLTTSDAKHSYKPSDGKWEFLRTSTDLAKSTQQCIECLPYLRLLGYTPMGRRRHAHLFTHKRSPLYDSERIRHALIDLANFSGMAMQWDGWEGSAPGLLSRVIDIPVMKDSAKFKSFMGFHFSEYGSVSAENEARVPLSIKDFLPSHTIFSDKDFSHMTMGLEHLEIMLEVVRGCESPELKEVIQSLEDKRKEMEYNFSTKVMNFAIRQALWEVGFILRMEGEALNAAERFLMERVGLVDELDTGAEVILLIREKLQEHLNTKKLSHYTIRWEELDSNQRDAAKRALPAETTSKAAAASAASAASSSKSSGSSSTAQLSKKQKTLTQAAPNSSLCTGDLLHYRKLKSNPCENPKCQYDHGSRLFATGRWTEHAVKAYIKKHAQARVQEEVLATYESTPKSDVTVGPGKPAQGSNK
jgi:hypothetical protein